MDPEQLALFDEEGRPMFHDYVHEGDPEE
ncbi:hypothetical protein TRIXIE_56 [Mycobacterium phage Trixie]|uniref:Uncharacterized protein n=1 Tax=Mycobacterium phage Trixie TaxID=1071503 RepID=G1JV14_9CAUD|nr:hypothetical protein TRIXIE_56 [Mycobacterium phage Trixie]AEL17903.1 hypothetical protein TRIXIE_56 [Mycobacterium phage Trixie]AOT24976.1 hypothetical protein PBI_KALPINE_56 [Mycobacterium phage Kalpine]